MMDWKNTLIFNIYLNTIFPHLYILNNFILNPKFFYCKLMHYGCKKQYIYTLIHNHPTNPKVIGRIAKAIGCRAVDIIDMEEDK